MPTMLMGLRINRVDLVDKGANQDGTGDGAHVLLFKRATPSVEGNMKLTDMTPEQLLKHAEDQATKIDEQATSITALETGKTDLDTKVADLTKSVEKLTKAAGKAAGDDPDEEILKGLPDNVRKLLDKKDEAITKAQGEAEEASKIAKAERETRLTKEYIVKADGLKAVIGKPADIAKQLRAIDEGLDEEIAKAVQDTISSLNDLVEKSELFKTLSRREDADEGSAVAEVAKRAKQKVEKGLAPTIEQARAAVFDEDPKLAVRMREEA